MIEHVVTSTQSTWKTDEVTVAKGCVMTAALREAPMLDVMAEDEEQNIRFRKRIRRKTQ